MGEVMGAVCAPRLYSPASWSWRAPPRQPVEAEEIVGAGATAALHVSRPRQALMGPRRFAFVDDSGVPVVGPGATVGTVETRVPRAGLPGPTTTSKKFR